MKIFKRFIGFITGSDKRKLKEMVEFLKQLESVYGKHHRVTIKISPSLGEQNSQTMGFDLFDGVYLDEALLEMSNALKEHRLNPPDLNSSNTLDGHLRKKWTAEELQNTTLEDFKNAVNKEKERTPLIGEKHGKK